MSPFSSKAIESNRQKQKLILDLAAAQAEIERLTSVVCGLTERCDDAREAAEKAIAERNEARAQVAAVASKVRSECADIVEREGHSLHVALRYVAIPAVAQAALEAYGREKVREGMHLAATIAGMKSAVLPHYPDFTRGYAQGRSGAREAILAKMEKLK